MNEQRFWFLRSAAAVLVAVCLWASATVGGERLVVHEWGTFTSLQDEQGLELPGINIDDEPAPKFVHNLNRFVLSNPVLSSLHWQYRQKAAPRHHPMVTMRLETPVIYFYPPQDQREPMTLDVSVRFRGGWLTEFYPRAEASAPGLGKGIFDFGALTPETVGGLTWRDLKVGVEARGPDTNDPVWLAPRDVAAAGVATPEGESEKFLFYRGVGNLSAPLRVRTDLRTEELSISGNFDQTISTDASVHIGSLWLTEIRSDGSCAFRTLEPIDVSADRRELAKVSGTFAEEDFSAENLQKLQSQMHAALVKDGLFADEATALLTTWQRAYFKSPGRRLFFLVPEAWTDYYLPLSLSRDADVERVMVARIELITKTQRNLLARLAATAPSDGRWLEQIPKTPAKTRFLAGRSDFGDLGVAIPPDYQMYLALGRFRNALVAAEERRRPTESLRKFIDTYQLHPYRLPTPATASGGRS